jgi:DNA replication and repair protein RecF
MHLNHLSLVNFKNCTESSFDFSKRVNCFLGNNGEGKTNLLDAIYYLSNCKSYFNSIDSQNVKFNEPFFVLQGRFELGQEKQEEIYCGVKIGQKKIVKKNKKQYKRLAEHVGLLPVVLITPYDSNLILDGSDIRRKFIDIIISQFDRDYLESLIHYNKVMAQRNALLKQFAESGKFEKDALYIWDIQLVEKGKIIHQKRKDFLEEFIPVFNQFYQDISNKSEEVGLHYSSLLNDDEFAVLLDNNIVKDRKSTYTSVGIHKDDLEFTIAGYPLKKFGSQGQQKSFLIALKLAKFNYIKSKKGFSPILLLDDIFDKLDETRVNFLLGLISKGELGQTFITDTSLTKVPTILKELNVNFKSFKITAGEVMNINMEEVV